MKIETENQKISRKIKARRILKGYTQEEMAKILGVSKATYVNMENKPLNLKLKIIKKLAKELGCKVEELFLIND